MVSKLCQYFQGKTIRHYSGIMAISISVLAGFVLGSCEGAPADGPTSLPGVIQDVVVHNVFSKDVQIADWTEEEGGIHIYDPSQFSMGFVRQEDRYVPPVQLPQNDELHLLTGQPLLLDLIVISQRHSTLLISVLVDYQQVPFTLDGMLSLLHEIRVEEGGDLYIPMQIDISEPGAHDFIIVAFRDPYNRPWDHEARDDCRVSGRRAVVIIDDIDEPVQTVIPDVVGVPPPPDVDFGVRVLFADVPTSPSDSSHPSQRQMRMTARGNAGELFRYQLWLSNYDLPDETVDYGLMRFLDFHQTEFKGKNLYVAHFDGRQEAIVEDQLELPAQPSVHEAQIVYVFDPYKSLLRNEVLAPFVFSSGCLGIDAR